jgi:hypothetical protein
MVVVAHKEETEKVTIAALRAGLYGYTPPFRLYPN